MTDRFEAPRDRPTLEPAVLARLDTLCHRHDLDAAAADRLARLLDLLADDPHAPTPIRAPAEAVDAHLADSLVALDLPEVRAAGTLADLGAGAGFPGLALASALPASHVVLVESVARKAAWIGGAAGAAGIANAEAVPERVETWAAGLTACDAVTARALAPLAVLAEYAAPLLRPGGVIVAWKAELSDGERAAGAAAAAELGLTVAQEVEVHPFPQARDRRLVVLRKDRPTPARYPRRPGMARKRPLGGAVRSNRSAR